MAYLHCHTKNCHWSQDDFWDASGYTPFRDDIIAYLKKLLFEDRVYMDSEFAAERPDILWNRDDKGIWCRGTELVASELERKARNIRKMVFRTEAEWRVARSSAVCPECGQRNFNVD